MLHGKVRKNCLESAASIVGLVGPKGEWPGEARKMEDRDSPPPYVCTLSMTVDAYGCIRCLHVNLLSGVHDVAVVE